MAGTIAGGKKAAEKNIEKYGPDFYAVIGAKGGRVTGKRGGFASTKIGPDGLTGKQRARIAGKIGGTKSKRGPKAQYDSVQTGK